jgi:two-component system, chemotaxis family, sensor kinase CheA
VSFRIDGYRDLYFSEAQQQLAHVADALQRLEHARADPAVLEQAFRATHTLKGMSATMGYDEVTSAAHALEDLLQGVRERPAGATASNLYFLARSLESLRETIASQASQTAPSRGDGAPPNEGANGHEHAPSGVPTIAHISTQELNQLNDLALRLLARAVKFAYGETDAHTRVSFSESLRLVHELLDAARHLRMAPLGEVFERYPCMLRDLARVQGKEIRVVLVGAEIEIGRALSEELNEPLLHILRNAIVHGIESRAERAQAGKDPCGTIEMRARGEDNSLIIEVADDGRGLVAEHILQAAYAQGFVSVEERRTLSAEEALNLITLPGLSLARVVTPLAGRGVGMDVVKAKVEMLRGELAIQSEPGRGTTFTLRLPRTHGPIEVELARVGGQVYALPTARIEFQVTVSSDELTLWRTGELPEVGRAFHVLDLAARLSAPHAAAPAASYGLVALGCPPGVALCVEALLGRALWSQPAEGQSPPIPLLDLDQLLQDFPGGMPVGESFSGPTSQ